MRKTYTYGNASQVKCYADGGVVKKEKMPAPKKGGTPKKITTEAPPGGKYTPGAKADAVKKPKKYADGGRVYGAPMGTEKPGKADKGRPKAGDKDPNFKAKPFKPSSPVKPPKKTSPKKRGKIPTATERRLRDNDVL